jgi:natural product precursor
MNKLQNIQGVKQLSREQLKNIVGGDDCGSPCATGSTHFNCFCYTNGITWSGCYGTVGQIEDDLTSSCWDGGGECNQG